MRRKCQLLGSSVYTFCKGMSNEQTNESIGLFPHWAFRSSYPASVKWKANFWSRAVPRQVRPSRRIFLKSSMLVKAFWIAGRVPYSCSNFRAIRSEMEGTHMSCRTQHVSRSAVHFRLDIGGVSVVEGKPGERSPL